MENHKNHTGSYNKNNSNPCTDKLSDLEYLEHMIPHHQVAIDMSILLEKRTTSDVMLHLCRQIIRKQSYEIFEMHRMKAYTGTLFTDDKSINKKPKNKTKLDIYNPISSKAKSGPCNPLFFKPNDHSKMMQNMKVTEKSYLEHMIPHHQVAIDMSNRLLLHTNNSYLIDFCRKLIIDQQYEILAMNDIIKSIHNLYKSSLLEDNELCNSL
jgi:uncharacterized protein (DUF305 family)